MKQKAQNRKLWSLHLAFVVATPIPFLVILLPDLLPVFLDSCLHGFCEQS